MVSRLYVPEPFYVIRGVPQGSVLGPVSFTLTNYDVHFYAGDIVLYLLCSCYDSVKDGKLFIEPSGRLEKMFYFLCLWKVTYFRRRCIYLSIFI